MNGNLAKDIPTWRYTALVDGKVVSRVAQASTRHELLRALQSEGWTPISIKESTGLSVHSDFAEIAAALVPGGGSGPKLKRAQLAQFTRRFHQMLRAGATAQTALSALAEQEQNPQMRRALNTIADRVTAGTPPHEAFEGYPKAFDDVYLAYLQTGHESGTMTQTTARLAHVLQQRASLEAKVKEVTMYPKLVTGAIFLMVAGILKWLVPQFASIYDSLGAELPAQTKFLMTLSANLPVAIGVFGALVFAAVTFVKRSRGRDPKLDIAVDRIRFRMPIFGNIARNLALFRWSSTAGGAMATGVAHGRALELASVASGSRWFDAITPMLVRRMEGGTPLSKLLEEHQDLVGADVRVMVATGEDSGEVHRMLDNVSQSIQEEVDFEVALIATRLEVAMLLFMGVVVGGILIALYMPILSMAGAVAGGA